MFFSIKTILNSQEGKHTFSSLPVNFKDFSLIYLTEQWGLSTGI